jgi:hypothetical protein
MERGWCCGNILELRRHLIQINKKEHILHALIISVTWSTGSQSPGTSSHVLSNLAICSDLNTIAISTQRKCQIARCEILISSARLILVIEYSCKKYAADNVRLQDVKDCSPRHD